MDHKKKVDDTSKIDEWKVSKPQVAATVSWLLLLVKMTEWIIDREITGVWLSVSKAVLLENGGEGNLKNGINLF